MREPQGRHELKHLINYCDMLQLRSRLPLVTEIDEHATAGNGYRVKSLYFDNYNDRALFEKIDGVDGREKFRLRLYNNDTSFIRLEKKSKHNGLCFKKSIVIASSECVRLLDGDPEVLKANGAPLCLELYAKMRYQQLRPATVVDYQREAFFYVPGNVRLTLDYDLRTGSNIRDFLSPQPLPVPLPEVYILEVKYDNFLPELIRGLVALPNRRHAAFSKYAATRII
ncbi:MAG: polyphosphate polymerase domain-containing protein [Clostridiaceae bacterium]|nr:polyphosphate polymerase domain-containing protein [Clostridiaceae bacterium]